LQVHIQIMKAKSSYQLFSEEKNYIRSHRNTVTQKCRLEKA